MWSCLLDTQSCLSQVSWEGPGQKEFCSYIIAAAVVFADVDAAGAGCENCMTEKNCTVLTR